MTDTSTPWDQLTFDDAEPEGEWNPLWILDGLRPGEFPNDQDNDG